MAIVRDPYSSAGADIIPRTDFEAKALTVMNRVAAAMRSLVNAVPGAVESAADLERKLGVTKKVAWQVYKITEARDAIAAATFVPGADPVRKLLAAAEKSRVPVSLRSELAEAFDAFESLVHEHAGDRASFLSMLDSMMGNADIEAGADVDRLHRRACFRSYSHFLGIQIATRYSIMMVREDPDCPGHNMFVSLRARLGLRRLRPEATVGVDRYFVTTGLEHLNAAPVPEPLDPVAFRKYSAPILPAFCTSPLPKLTTIDEGGGIARVELAEREVGRSGAADLVLGTVTRAVPRPHGRDGAPHGFHTMSTNDVPTQLIVLDAMVRRADFGIVKPETYVYANPRAEESKEQRDKSPLLRCRERVEHVGSGLSSTASGDLPCYTEMVAHICGRLGWDPNEFDVYRLRIEYPLMHTAIRVAVPLDGSNASASTGG